LAEGKPILLAGVLGEDRARPLFETISRFARKIVLCEPDQPRATPVERLRELIPDSFKGEVEAVEIAACFSPGPVCSIGNPGDTILVTGSIYLIGEILAQLEPIPVKEADLQD